MVARTTNARTPGLARTGSLSIHEERVHNILALSYGASGPRWTLRDNSQITPTVAELSITEEQEGMEWVRETAGSRTKRRDDKKAKVPIASRLFLATRAVLVSSYVNMLLVFVPIGITVGGARHSGAAGGPGVVITTPVKDEIRIVQASLLGSMLANLLLNLGMYFLLGGLRFREQVYNPTVTQTIACL